MIIGIGIDVIEIERVESAVRNPLFCKRLFTVNEQAYCESRGAQRAASYAARFAGKEAFVKALGTGFVGGKWQDIEILPDQAGRPEISLAGHFAMVACQYNVSKIYISLSHSRDYAVAQVILWGEAKNENCLGV